VDIQAYIASGKLELFVLGELGEREREEVLRMARLYPEIRKELDQIEEAMFQLDEMMGKAPSPAVRSRIFDTLSKDLAAAKAIQDKQLGTATASLRPWKTYFAAASVVAILAIFTALYFLLQYREANEKYLSLAQEQEYLAAEIDQLKAGFEQSEAQLETLLAGEFQKVQMKGKDLPLQKDALVDVWWDPASQNVFVSVNTLDALDGDFDYQLWAIGDQGPVGIGLVRADQRFTLQQMDAVAAAGAFAVTIEPKGGSQSPTLEKLVVIGTV
jgi:anti-sigma-K factor RskA